MSDSTNILAAGLAAAYAILALLVMVRDREQRETGLRLWLVLTLLAALAAALVHVLPADADTRYADYFIQNLTQPALGVIAVNLMIVLFGTQTLRYLQFRSVGVWLVPGLIWWGVQVGVTLSADTLIIGQDGWLSEIYDPVDVPGVVAVGGWVVIGTLLLAASFYAYYKARLPELANQALFWTVVIPLVLMGAVLGTSGSDVLAEIGWFVEFLGLLGAVYGISVYRVFDLRRALRQATANGILTIVTALVFFAALVLAQDIDSTTEGFYVILALLAVGVALAYVPFRNLAQGVVNRLFGGPAEGVSQKLRQFSEDITGVVELDALVDVTMNTLGQVLQVRRGGLVLVTKETSSALHIEPVTRGLGEIPDIKGRLVLAGPICTRLLKKRAPLLQYDLDFGRAYADTTPEERAFFQQLRMSAYAPVVVQGHLIGILCCGAKASDDPFTDHDLELLMTIANQAGVALRNARLVSDLRRREGDQADLNKALSATKERLERLDGVKTDFITIASHELRTPLAQIRGYTDILEAMNSDGMLDQDQVAGMTGNLRKAADRLEDLIGAMLDVSQLDVNAMDLRFTETSVENVMRMAIEPLTESIKNRKLMLSARGLRDLPPIQADMQRLVQAFRNVVLNAIKFTPDGGRIDITGKTANGEILVSIKDSGIGIDPANHELIFEKFFRAHDPSLHSTGATKFMGAGPGLGLTIAKGVIEGHGGRIWVESARYDPETFPGSIFTIALPLTPPDDARRVLPFETTTGLDLAQIQAALDAGAVGATPANSPTLVRRPEGL